MYTSHSDSRGWALLLAGCALYLSLLPGCDEPLTNELTRIEPPRILLGPYITPLEGEPGAFELRFRTTQRCAIGLQFADDDRMLRYASGQYDHRIRLDKFLPGTERTCKIWLDNIEGPTVSLRAPVTAGGPVRLAFLGRIPASAPPPPGAGEALAALGPDGIVLTAPWFNEPASDKEWAQQFFRPLGPALVHAPVYLPPGTANDLPARLFPVKETEAYAWFRQIGAVYLVGLDSRLLRLRQQRQQLLDWLDRALTARPRSAIWTVLLLTEPLIGPREANPRAIQALGDLLERHQVHLVLSGGDGAYHRTVPLSRHGQGQVRYALSAGLGPIPTPGAGREYTAAYAAEPHVSLLAADEGGLEWTTVALNGKAIDTFRLLVGSDNESGEIVLDKESLLGDALAVSTQRREVLSLARQACRAISDPEQPTELRFHVLNPSAKPFAGRLVWSIPPNARWQVEPAEQDWSLQSGQAAVVTFRIAPAEGDRPPVLLVDSPGIGYIRQALVLRKRKSTQIPLAEEAVQADGRFSEPLWQTAAKLEGFTVLHTEAKPDREVLCSVTATPAGLAVAIQCECERPAAIPSSATSRDGAVEADESVSLFIDTSRNGREYKQFAVNIKGIRLDRSSRHGLDWNPPWQSAVRFGRTDEGVDYYNVEILIPYQTLGHSGPPQPGEQWAINVVRHDLHYTLKKDKQAQTRQETIQWAPTQGSNFRSGCYGLATFVRPQPATPANTGTAQTQ